MQFVVDNKWTGGLFKNLECVGIMPSKMSYAVFCKQKTVPFICFAELLNDLVWVLHGTRYGPYVEDQ